MFLTVLQGQMVSEGVSQKLWKIISMEIVGEVWYNSIKWLLLTFKKMRDDRDVENN